jgi:hypothetical protein
VKLTASQTFLMAARAEPSQVRRRARDRPEHEPFRVAVGGKDLACAVSVLKGSRVAAQIVTTEENRP